MGKKIPETMDRLLPIKTIIKEAKRAGVNFGRGNPKVHLAYLTKLRLLPQTIRRKIAGKMTGCYPQTVIPLLRKVEQLKRQGFTYRQIQMNYGEMTSPLAPQVQPGSAIPAYLLTPGFSLAFVLIGLMLGYLAAAVNYPKTVSVSAPEENQARAAAVSAAVPAATPIYLIALPSQNLYKLGKVDISTLVSD